jgi:hypothetical protein
MTGLPTIFRQFANLTTFLSEPPTISTTFLTDFPTGLSDNFRLDLLIFLMRIRMLCGLFGCYADFEHCCTFSLGLELGNFEFLLELGNFCSSSTISDKIRYFPIEFDISLKNSTFSDNSDIMTSRTKNLNLTPAAVDRAHPLTRLIHLTTHPPFGSPPLWTLTSNFFLFWIFGSPSGRGVPLLGMNSPGVKPRGFAFF